VVGTGMSAGHNKGRIHGKCGGALAVADSACMGVGGGPKQQSRFGLEWCARLVLAWLSLSLSLSLSVSLSLPLSLSPSANFSPSLCGPTPAR
jgi:hypothetical protein